MRAPKKVLRPYKKKQPQRGPLREVYVEPLGVLGPFTGLGVEGFWVWGFRVLGFRALGFRGFRGLGSESRTLQRLLGHSGSSGVFVLKPKALSTLNPKP